jgi:hypothetical protein
MLATAAGAVLYVFTLTLPAFGGVAAHIEAKSLDACTKMLRITKVQLMLAGVEHTLSPCERRATVQAARGEPAAAAMPGTADK